MMNGNNCFFILFSSLFVSSLCEKKGENDTYCESTYSCESQIRYSICINNTCQCELDHYAYEELNITFCAQCPANQLKDGQEEYSMDVRYGPYFACDNTYPSMYFYPTTSDEFDEKEAICGCRRGLGEYCGDTQCCMDSGYLTCSNEFCRCLTPYVTYFCWDAEGLGKGRLESLAQIILFLGLLFALAVLGSLIWRLCTRHEISRQQSQATPPLQRQASFSSLNSLQRMVLMRLEDRPPPYNPGFDPWKLYNHGAQNYQNFPPEAPPPYQVSIVSSAGGRENSAFNGEELASQQSTACSVSSPTSNDATEDNRKSKCVQH